MAPRWTELWSGTCISPWVATFHTQIPPGPVHGKSCRLEAQKIPAHLHRQGNTPLGTSLGYKYSLCARIFDQQMYIRWTSMLKTDRERKLLC